MEGKRGREKREGWVEREKKRERERKREREEKRNGWMGVGVGITHHVYILSSLCNSLLAQEGRDVFLPMW